MTVFAQGLSTHTLYIRRVEDCASSHDSLVEVCFEIGLPTHNPSLKAGFLFSPEPYVDSVTY